MTNYSPGYPETIDIAKAQAKRLSKALEPRLAVSHGQALELVAKTHGERNWGAMSARFEGVTVSPIDYDLGLPHHGTGATAPHRNIAGWTPEELERLVALLRIHPRVSTTPRYRSMLDKVVAEGCVVASNVDSLLDAVSSQLGDFAFAMRGGRLVELCGIVTESYLYRPEPTDEGTMGFQALSVAAAAALMIKLERLGLDTHPEHLVSVVNKSAAGRPMLTKHELDCLWYRSEKEGAGRQRLTAGAFYEDEDIEHEAFVTATGHACSVYRGASGKAEVVLVDPPSGGPYPARDASHVLSA